MSDHSLTRRQEDLLRRLVEAYNRLQPDEELFHYLRDFTVAADLAILQHRGRPEGWSDVFMGDLEALTEDGYIRRWLLGRPGRGWAFTLRREAFDYFESPERPPGEDSKARSSSITESVDPILPSSMLILDEIRDGRIHEKLLARIIGTGRFDGVDHKIGRRQLFFSSLLFQSTRTHKVVEDLVTVVTEDYLTEKLQQWVESDFLEFNPMLGEMPKHRLEKMWREFVGQMDKDVGLKGIFVAKLPKEKGHKLFGLCLLPKETQIRVPDIGALLKR
jgi:hypothetical protein